MNITLIGMAGVGKSVIGKKLAEKLHYNFIDIDEIIEKKLNLKLQEIIDKFGEPNFLKIEEETILKLGKFYNSVISPGGSAIYSINAMNFLKNNSTIIFLNASSESIKNRIVNQSTRGIIGIKEKNFEILFHERIPLYKKYAKITIEVSEDFNVNAIVKEITKKVKLNS